MSNPVILEMKGIVKSFGPVKALKGVDFDLRAGEVHALMGENGAGKSTLMKVLTGIHKPNEGSIHYNGKQVEYSKLLFRRENQIIQGKYPSPDKSSIDQESSEGYCQAYPVRELGQI